MRSKTIIGILLGITVFFLVLLMPIVNGIGIYQELPTTVKVGEEYNDVLIEIQEDDPDGFDGVKSVTLLLNTTQGNTLAVLASEDKPYYIHKWNLYDGYENFYLSFKIPEDLPIEEGKEYTFKVDTVLYDYFDVLGGKYFQKSNTYAVFIEKGENPYLTVGLIVGIITGVIIALILIIRYRRKEKKE
jgi:hypothetical protein